MLVEGTTELGVVQSGLAMVRHSVAGCGGEKQTRSCRMGPFIGARCLVGTEQHPKTNFKENQSLVQGLLRLK
jgi:hypothetical protein